MKRSKFIFAAAVLIASSMLFSSCFGSFSLTKKVYTFNKGVGDKFVNELVFLALNIIPVYDIAVFADAVVFNTIEFWTGSNPIAYNVKHVKGEKGNYTVETSSKGYKITNDASKEVVVLSFNANAKTWSAEAKGQKVDLMTFVDDNHVKMYGSDAVVELSQAGTMAYSAIVNGNMAVACK
jgi:hypothetical protein